MFHGLVVRLLGRASPITPLHSHLGGGESGHSIRLRSLIVKPDPVAVPVLKAVVESAARMADTAGTPKVWPARYRLSGAPIVRKDGNGNILIAKGRSRKKQRPGKRDRILMKSLATGFYNPPRTGLYVWGVGERFW